MNDAQIASVGRRLAQAFNYWARSRDRDDWQEVLRIATDLCRVCREEDAEQQNGQAAE